MRVALFVDVFPAASETFLVSKLTRLAADGHDVHVVCRRLDRDAWEAYPELRGRAGLLRRVHVQPVAAPARVAFVLQAARSLAVSLATRPLRTARYVRRGRRRFGRQVLFQLHRDGPLVALGPDVLHFEFGAAAVGRTYLKELLGTRVVVSLRGYDVNYAGLDDPGFYDEVWQAADCIHANGEDLWARALARGCPASLRHVLVPPAVDTGFFRPQARQLAAVGTVERPLRLVSVGRLVWKKGYEFALAAVRRLADEGVAVEYRIVGEGEHRPALEHCVRELELGACVSLLGPCAHEVVRDELQRADALLHAAVSEGFPNAVLEGQAMELPVVCTDADGSGEAAEDGVTAFVVPRRDPLALAEKLSLLAQDPGLRARMGRAGRERVELLFRPERQLKAYADLYRSLVSGS